MCAVPIRATSVSRRSSISGVEELGAVFAVATARALTIHEGSAPRNIVTGSAAAGPGAVMPKSLTWTRTRWRSTPAAGRGSAPSGPSTKKMAAVTTATVSTCTTCEIPRTTATLARSSRVSGTHFGGRHGFNSVPVRRASSSGDLSSSISSIGRTRSRVICHQNAAATTTRGQGGHRRDQLMIDAISPPAR